MLLFHFARIEGFGVDEVTTCGQEGIVLLWSEAY